MVFFLLLNALNTHSLFGHVSTTTSFNMTSGQCLQNGIDIVWRISSWWRNLNLSNFQRISCYSCQRTHFDLNQFNCAWHWIQQNVILENRSRAFFNWVAWFFSLCFSIVMNNLIFVQCSSIPGRKSSIDEEKSKFLNLWIENGWILNNFQLQNFVLQTACISHLTIVI